LEQRGVTGSIRWVHNPARKSCSTAGSFRGGGERSSIGQAIYAPGQMTSISWCSRAPTWITAVSYRSSISPVIGDEEETLRFASPAISTGRSQIGDELPISPTGAYTLQIIF
jgi:hypothetical protein